MMNQTLDIAPFTVEVGYLLALVAGGGFVAGFYLGRRGGWPAFNVCAAWVTLVFALGLFITGTVAAVRAAFVPDSPWLIVLGLFVMGIVVMFSAVYFRYPGGPPSENPDPIEGDTED